MMEMVRNSTSTKTNCAAKLRSELLTSSSWWAVWDCKGCVEASIADAGGQQPELCRLAPAVAACLSRVPGTWWTYSGGLLKGWWMSSLFSCVTSGLRRRGLYLWTLEANGRNCAGWHAAAAAPQPRLGLFCSDESARTGWSRESTAADWAEKQTGGWWNRLAKQVVASCAINIPLSGWGKTTSKMKLGKTLSVKSVCPQSFGSTCDTLASKNGLDFDVN